MPSRSVAVSVALMLAPLLPYLACIACGANVAIDAEPCADEIELCPNACDDRDPCTEDQCVAGACVWAPITGSPCSRPDVEGPAVCLYGACVASCETSEDCEPRPCRLAPSCPFWTCAYQLAAVGSTCAVDGVLGACDAGGVCVLGSGGE